MPTPADADNYVTDGKVNVANFWRLMGRPAAASNDGEIWFLGEGAEARNDALIGIFEDGAGLTDPFIGWDVYAVHTFEYITDSGEEDEQQAIMDSIRNSQKQPPGTGKRKRGD